MGIPALRVATLRDNPVNTGGQYVLYWMVASRRMQYNFALDRALEWSRQLHKPLVILEALRVGYQWASDRFHHFVIDGMADNVAACESSPVHYYPYIEPRIDAGKGLVQNLAASACVVVTDEFPCFMLPRMVAAAASQVSVRFESVDSNGLLPLRATNDTFPSAYAFRRFLQKNLKPFLSLPPCPDPLSDLPIPRLERLPDSILARWPRAQLEFLRSHSRDLSSLSIDHAVGRTTLPGGTGAARARLSHFLAALLPRYAEDRNEPSRDGSSGLSPYLHFGHISTHEILEHIAKIHSWSPANIAASTAGKRQGWWGLPAHVEGFLDELVTWRELGYNFSAHRPADYDQYSSLPAWAQETLQLHREDARPYLYDIRSLAESQTHDSIWNAAQRQLVREGKIHNYLRMLWGKKILEWSPSAEDALKVLIELNNRYALDGRNPNSYSGIFWTLGRFDRPWGPERPIFGTIRYMSSDNTAKKFDVKPYCARFAAEHP